MAIQLCYNCMRELSGSSGVCEHCGYDNRNGVKENPGYALPWGTVLWRRYVVGRMLGHGGFGITYIGYDTVFLNRVCIKEYFPEGAAWRDSTQSRTVSWGGSSSATELKQGRDSFVKEARKAVKLRDVNSVVQVWEVFYENDTAYIVMDYVDGITLKDHLVQTGQPLTLEESLKLLEPVIADLDKIHEKGIIHRDISPDNLMLQPDNRVKLMDLGAAKDLAGSSADQSAMVVAKHGFTPLEQYAAGSKIGPWTDVYAMCATICWLVTGKKIPSAIDRMDGSEIDLGAFPDPVKAVLKKGLALNYRERIQSMGELLTALKNAMAGSKQRHKKTWLIPAAAVLALLLAFGAYWLYRDGGIENPEPDSTQAPLTAEGLNALGDSYYYASSFEAAKEWYEKAAEAGNAEAMNSLGWIYQNGFGVEQDYAKAREWYEKGAAAGNADAMNNLGRLYEKGQGVEQDYAKAKEWYEKGIVAGNSYAMFNLGWLYGNGYGVEQDYTKAKEWYEKASDAGSADAMNNLGVLYENGQGVEQDYAKAKEWYEKAAAAGDAYAMGNLGVLYVNGFGVEQDFAKAKEWFEKAATAGNPYAMSNLGWLYENGFGVGQDYAKAKEWYEKAAEAGNPYAMNNLGWLYENGYGVKKDYAKAKEWYEKAAEAGY